MRKIFWILFSIAILIFILIMFGGSTITTGGHYFGRKTLRQIYGYELTFDVFYKKLNIPQMKINYNPVQINELLTKFFVIRTNNGIEKIEIMPFKSPSLIEGIDIFCNIDVCVDYWGTPFRIYVDKENINRQKSGLNSVTNEFIMWSCGRNKSNEFGLGDDYNSWESSKANFRRVERYGEKVFFWQKWLDFLEDKLKEKFSTPAAVN